MAENVPNLNAALPDFTALWHLSLFGGNNAAGIQLTGFRMQSLKHQTLSFSCMQ